MLRTAGLLAFLSEDFVSGLRRPDFASFVASSPLSYSAAGSLPRPDLHRQALWGFSGHTPSWHSDSVANGGAAAEPESPGLRQESTNSILARSAYRDSPTDFKRS